MFNSAAVEVTPSNMFNSAAVEVTLRSDSELTVPVPLASVESVCSMSPHLHN